MSEKEMTESSQVEGTEGAPTSESSGNKGVQPTSQFNPDQLLKQVEQIIERKLQSDKDRRVAKLERTVNELQPVLERFKGLVPDDKLNQIQRDLEFEDLKRRVYGEAEPSSGSQAGNQQSNATDGMAKVIDEVLQLPANDSRVTELKLKYGSDTAAYLREGLKLAAKLGEAQDDSTPAEQPLPTGGTARKVDNPIADIEDSKTLYRLAARQMARGRSK